MSDSKTNTGKIQSNRFFGVLKCKSQSCTFHVHTTPKSAGHSRTSHMEHLLEHHVHFVRWPLPYLV